MIDIQGIMDRIPHRYPFLLVDRILELDPGASVHAIKNVTFNEPFFIGHFPGAPIMPGVLIVEAMAQAGAMLALGNSTEALDNKLLLFRGIDGAKFRRTVVPGDQLHLYAKAVKQRASYWTMACEARVDGELAAEATLAAIVADRPEADG